jgi:hypothetical protein
MLSNHTGIGPVPTGLAAMVVHLLGPEKCLPLEEYPPRDLTPIILLGDVHAPVPVDDKSLVWLISIDISEYKYIIKYMLYKIIYNIQKYIV